MNLETVIQEKVHALPLIKQAKVLAFVEDLESDGTNGQVNQTETVLENEREAKRRSIIGMFSSGKSDISERAEEILAAGINRRSGWSVKDESLVD